MTNTEDIFRPLIYLRLLGNLSGQNTSYRLCTSLYLPNTYTVVSSGYSLDNPEDPYHSDVLYTLYVQEKSTLTYAEVPGPEDNLELMVDGESNQMNWRSSNFESLNPDGSLIAIVSDVTPGKNRPKGKSKIVLADADDTDLKPIA